MGGVKGDWQACAAVAAVALTLTATAAALELPLPPRPATAPSGSEVVALLTPLSLSAREQAIIAQVASGNVPDFQRQLVPVTVTRSAGGASHTVTFHVLPDYLALGADDDYFLCPMTPLAAQPIADLAEAMLPTRRMVDDIWAAAAVKLAPSPITWDPANTTVPVFADHAATVWGQRQAFLHDHPLGALVAGDKKDVVVTPLLQSSPDRVAIYGWHSQSGTPIQPLSTVHGESYVDYSHGIRLVALAAELDGAPTTVPEILADPSLAALLSDEGTVPVPRYDVPPEPLASVVASGVGAGVVELRHAVAAGFSYRLSVDLDPAFPDPLVVDGSSGLFVLDGLVADALYHLQLARLDDGAPVEASELLSATASAAQPLLLVNGYDRARAANTRDFVPVVATAAAAAGLAVASCSNEALLDPRTPVGPEGARFVAWLLGEESTADATFTPAEQDLVTAYLAGGGRLLVSGAELAWDLEGAPGHPTAADTSFLHDVLQVSYVSDAAGGSTRVADSTDLFPALPAFDFGTAAAVYPVLYPDGLAPSPGAEVFLAYQGADPQTHGVAGVGRVGSWVAGDSEAALVVLGFPLETVVEPSLLSALVGRVDDYLLPAGGPAWLFGDGFETGSTVAWSALEP